jgi:hypothetical protein
VRSLARRIAPVAPNHCEIACQVRILARTEVTVSAEQPAVLRQRCQRSQTPREEVEGNRGGARGWRHAALVLRDASPPARLAEADRGAIVAFAKR